MNSGYEIYPKLFNTTLNRFHETIIDETQNGIHKGRSYVGGYFSLELLIEKQREFNLHTYMAFMDFKRPSVELTEIYYLDSLKKVFKSWQLIKAIHSIYKVNLIVIIVRMECLEWEAINKGAF